MAGKAIDGRRPSAAQVPNGGRENTVAKPMSRIRRGSGGRCAIVEENNGGAEWIAAAKQDGSPFRSSTRF